MFLSSTSSTKTYSIKSTTVCVPSSKLRLSQDPHPHSHASECGPPPPHYQRGEAHPPADEGVGEFQFRRLEKKFLGTLFFLQILTTYFIFFIFFHQSLLSSHIPYVQTAVGAEPVFVNPLRSPGLDFQDGGPARQPYLSCPTGYIGWRNRFLGIDARAP